MGVDGISDFNALHSGKHNEEVQLCAFDVLAMDARRSAPATTLDAQSQSRPAARWPARWDLPEPV